MATHAIAGDLYFGSITAVTGTTGTKITNVEGHIHEFTIAQDGFRFKSGRLADKVVTFYGGMSSAVFIVRARDFTDAALNLLYGDLSSSGGLQSNQATSGGRAQARALIVRPRVAGEKALYIPNAVIRPLEEVRINFSILGPFLDEQAVAFVPDRDTGNTEPAFMYDTPTNLVAAYAGLS